MRDPTAMGFENRLEVSQKDQPRARDWDFLVNHGYHHFNLIKLVKVTNPYLLPYINREREKTWKKKSTERKKKNGRERDQVS